MTSTPTPRSHSDGSRPSFADVSADVLIQVGFVFRPHGLDGELKVNPEYTDDPARFETLETVYLGRERHEVTEHSITSVRYQETKRGTTVILGISGVTTRDDSEAVTKQNVYAHEDALDLGEGEVFVHDLVGLTVVTEAEGEVIGTVSNYVEMPAQDVYVIQRTDGEEAMIPAVDDFVVEVDLEGERLVVRPLDGLLE